MVQVPLAQLTLPHPVPLQLPPLILIDVPAPHDAPEHGGTRPLNGSAAAGVPYTGQGPVSAQVTVPPGPLWFALPETPNESAFTISLFPFVLKSPLSTIPQFAAFRTALPFMFTPSMLEVGGPNVYKHPLFGPPLVFVATARAVTTCLVTPKIFMK